MIPTKNSDYIILYATKLKENSGFFAGHKKLIDSQIKSSNSLFGNMFKENFKEGARDYLKKRRIIK
jgi:hypothetical protein